MAQDIALLYQNCDPMESLPPDDPRYVVCESVRGETDDIIARLAMEIRWSPNPVCRLLAGHRGAGKSTELQRLKQALEHPQYGGDKIFVVYYEADKEDIDVNDVDFPDLLLSIIRHLATSVRKEGIELRSSWLSSFFDHLKDLAVSEVELQKLEFDAKIAKFTAAIKTSPNFRQKIRGELEPKVSSLLQAANELLGEAISRLKELGYKNLVLIVDNLDRIVLRELDAGRSTHSRFFLERGEQLKSFKCPVIYTLPISMVFSTQAPALTSIYGRPPDVLPMVKVIERDGSDNLQGLAVMRQVVLSRLEKATITEQQAFDDADTLNYLCRMSGGHLRNLLILVRSTCLSAGTLPLTYLDAEKAVREMGNGHERALTKPEYFDVLRQIDRSKQLTGGEYDPMLLYYLNVLEYQNGEVWYAVNPAVRQLKRFQG
jgi:hypothetical protein